MNCHWNIDILDDEVTRFVETSPTMFKKFLLLPSHSLGKLVIHEADIVTWKLFVAREVDFFSHLFLSLGQRGHIFVLSQPQHDFQKVVPNQFARIAVNACQQLNTKPDVFTNLDSSSSAEFRIAEGVRLHFQTDRTLRLIKIVHSVPPDLQLGNRGLLVRQLNNHFEGNIAKNRPIFFFHLFPLMVALEEVVSSHRRPQRVVHEVVHLVEFYVSHSIPILILDAQQLA